MAGLGYMRTLNKHLGQFDAVVNGLTLALNAGAQGWNAYNEFRNQDRADDALKLERQKLQAELMAVQAARDAAAANAEAALLANQSAASAGMAAARAESNGGTIAGIPTPVVVIGVAVVAIGAIMIMKKRRR